MNQSIYAFIGFGNAIAFCLALAVGNVGRAAFHLVVIGVCALAAKEIKKGG